MMQAWLWLLGWCLPLAALASNWAQTTGVLSQNIALPTVPSLQHPHWSGRMGMAVAVSNVSDDGETKDDALARQRRVLSRRGLPFIIRETRR